MTSREFCYWFQGYLELNDTTGTGLHSGLSVDQLRKVKRHLDLVFAHEIDPSQGNDAHQAALNQIHNGNDADSAPRC